MAWRDEEAMEISEGRSSLRKAARDEAAKKRRKALEEKEAKYVFMLRRIEKGLILLSQGARSSRVDQRHGLESCA